MAKRVAKKRAKRPPSPLDDYRQFSLADARDLLEVAQKWTGPLNLDLAKLQKSLNRASLEFTFQNLPGHPAQSVQIKAFAKIEAAARRLLVALSAPNGRVDEMHIWVRGLGGLEDFNRNRAVRRAAPEKSLIPLENAIEGIWQIGKSAKFIGDQKSGKFFYKPERKRSTKQRPTRTPDKAANAFLRALEEVWREDFHREDVRTKAFYAFASAAFKHLDPDSSDIAVRRRAERLSTRSKSK